MTSRGEEAAIFGVAVLTDYLDGHLARRRRRLGGARTAA